MKWRPACLTSRWALSCWELICSPTSLLSSQEISVTDSPWHPLSPFAERMFDCFRGPRR